MIILDEEGKRVDEDQKAIVGTTAVYFLLDQTGSMEVVKDQTISGFNEYIQGLKAGGLDMQFTLALFNESATEIRHKSVKLNEIAKLNSENYVPGFGTPLYDALGKLLIGCAADVAEKHLVIIMTDGENNASKEFTLEKINELIRSSEEKGWDFVYLGANHNAWEAGQQFGLKRGNVMAYTAGATGQSLRAMSNVTNSYAQSVGGSDTIFSDAGTAEEDFKESK